MFKLLALVFSNIALRWQEWVADDEPVYEGKRRAWGRSERMRR